MTLLNRSFLIGVGWVLGLATTVHAQSTDTLRLSLPQAEQQFLDRNFQLLAQRYQIDISTAAVQQAGLKPNPNVFFQTNFFNPQTGKFFQYGHNSAADLAASQFNKGGMTVQVQQLIQLAGKRSKLVQLAESNRNLQTLAFRDVLRNLHYQLYSTYANLYFNLQALSILRAEETRQQGLVTSYRSLVTTGGVAPYEVTRLEVALRDLQASIADYRSQIADEEATLRVLLRPDQPRFILPTELPIVARPLPPIAAALDSAQSNRPDAGLAQEQVNNAQRSLTLERARRTPDMTAGFIFDKYGNAFNNFTGLYTSIDLPVRNRNQGNIKIAEIQVDASKKAVENQQTVIESDVLNAYDKLNTAYEQQAGLSADYQSRVQTISIEATRSYNNRVIGLLDYLDKIRTYQQAQLNRINLQNKLFQSQQLFDYVTNTRFF
ncbi:outer membrane efflux protein [Fibrisoma limi BUZ 3]|uniref:Outer membrane efflux protein n=1 Tax=Fibrisoma limi BUZ 3 TaxID=1185876 RepID=I2GMF0_9BACT|nr:TolC family protein [Fibrisoma limi]CCH55077.1 outer membrane efflux protein [Fibrisoma limi BUZ 3]